MPKTASVSLQPKDPLLGVATAERQCQDLQKGITWIGTGGEDSSPELPCEKGWKTTKFLAIREHNHLSAIGRRDRSGEIPEELSRKPSDILRPHLMCQSTGNRHWFYGDECVLVTKPTRCEVKSDTAQGLCPIKLPSWATGCAPIQETWWTGNRRSESCSHLSLRTRRWTGTTQFSVLRLFFPLQCVLAI